MRIPYSSRRGDGFYHGDMSKATRPIPEGFRGITPHLDVKGAAEYMSFLERAFGAVKMSLAPGPDGRIIHAMARIGDSFLMFNDDYPEYAGGPIAEGRWPFVLHLYVPDADAAFTRAVNAGCKVAMPLADQFWGDRYGQVKDPFGFTWAIATHVEDVAPEEMQARMKAAFSGAPPATGTR